jgi:replication-associated recombination protein RarA
MLVSPPGAGKTHLAEELIDANANRHCRRIDCSSDELVERALDSILEESFPVQGDMSLLVADEFHMLSKSHKNELFQWVTPRLFWLKVILLANRSDGKK